MEWHRLAPSFIRSGKDDSGERLILGFAKEFERKMGRRLNIGCPSCFLSDFHQYSNHFNSDTMANYKVQPRYEGLTKRIDGKIEVLSNVGLTDELAEKFVKNHPRGLDLFQKFPESAKDLLNQSEGVKVNTKLSREELDEIATSKGLNPEDYKNKKQLVEAINEQA